MRANILDRRGFAMALAGSLGVGVLALVLVTGLPAVAQSPGPGPGPVTARDMFVANAIPVDVTAANVTEARERGLTLGRVAGFRKVIERIVAPEDQPRVPQLSAAQIIDVVRDFSIANERSSAVRYLAELTVRFDPLVIRRMLRAANIPFTETLSKPLVVIPMMRETAAAPWLLWEDTNAWRMAWSHVPRDLGLVPLIVPVADLADIAALQSDQAAIKDLTALNAFAARYGGDGTILALATAGGDGLQISLVELRHDLPSEELILTQKPEAGQSRDDLLAAAARAGAMSIQDGWKRRNRVAFGGTTQITALVPVADLKEWLTVKGRLDSVPLIDRLELQAITRDRAQVTLYYAGAQRQLELAMAQHDLELALQNGVWIIQARGQASGVAASRVPGQPGGDPAPGSASEALPQ